jgi:hypothetical protein
MPSGSPFDFSKRTPPPYQPKDKVEVLASDIAREVCRTMPMMQRQGADDQEIQARLRNYIQQQLTHFAAEKLKD